MSLLEELGLRERKPDTAVPDAIKRRLARGREEMKRDAPKRRLCMRFEQGDTYYWVNGKNVLSSQSTVTNPDGTGKPPHRVRNQYNLIRPIVQGKVSAATQRIPSYQVMPSTTDQDRVDAAQMAEKVALFGYDKWRLRQNRVKAVNYAIGRGGEAFGLPYFDPNVGPYVEVSDEETGESRMVGTGEIKVLIVNGNEAYWEPGVSFDESRWWAIERAVAIDDVKELPGFFGFPITADANTSDMPTETRSLADQQLVMKTDYFERPCQRYPEGRFITTVNGKLCVPEQPYPMTDAKGRVIDEPCLHRLAWDAETQERDFGLTWQLIDCERTIQDAMNKAVEWKNRCLMPQMIAPVNSLIGRRTDEPGAITYYQGQQAPTWESPPPIPDSLFRIIDQTQAMMRTIASDDQAEQQANYSNVAAKTLVAAAEQSMNRWQSFLAGLAEWDSRMMRHCLTLAARYYTEPRLIKIRGRDGWERIPDFQGSDLMSEVDVRVFPDSLVPLTRQGVQDQLTWIATTFPGWLNPQDALAAMQSGSLDRLTQSYWLDVSRANNVIQKIRDGTVMDMPPRGDTNPMNGEPTIDPVTGQPMQIPGWMPSDQDNLAIWEKVFGDWMKTDDYARTSPEGQQVAQDIWDGLQALKIMKAQREAALQTQMAEQQGMTNAAKPQGATPMPSMPGSDGPPPAAV